MGDMLLGGQVDELLGRPRKVAERLTELDHLDPGVVEVLRDQRCRPGIIGDLADVVGVADLVDDLRLDDVVVDHVSGRRANQALFNPATVRHAVALLFLIDAFLGDPEKRQHVVHAVVGKHQHQCRDVVLAREVKPAVTDFALEAFGLLVAGVPFRLIDPT